MTGFGQGSAESPGLAVTVVLRTVNNRFADLRFRLPQELASKDREIRRKILAHVKRGRVDLSLAVERARENEAAPTFNRALLEEMVAAHQIRGEEFGIRGDLAPGTLLSAPGMFRTDAPDMIWDDADQKALFNALDTALSALDQDRRREGKVLQDEMLERLSAMSELSDGIRSRAAVLPGLARTKLEERLKSLVGDLDLDQGRLEQEAVFLVDRADVTEETVRLAGHLEQANQLLGKPDGAPIGKRLEFLLQEMHRETNTINSKSADLEMSRSALALKVETEKLREQIQNLE